MSCWPAAGLIEIREFMARFVDQVPNLDDLEAAFADPTHSQQHMQVNLSFIAAHVVVTLIGTHSPGLHCRTAWRVDNPDRSAHTQHPAILSCQDLSVQAMLTATVRMHFWLFELKCHRG